MEKRRGRGRPKGSVNKSKGSSRGRPRGSSPRKRVVAISKGDPAISNQFDEYPVKLCSRSCRYRRGKEECEDFMLGRVESGGVCLVELREIKKWVDAYSGGDTKVIKENAGAVQGALVRRIYAMLEQIDGEGLTFTVPKFTKDGNVVRYTDSEGKEKIIYEMKEHPLLKRITELAKISDISARAFGLVGDEPAEMRGVIGSAEQVNMQVVMDGQAERLEEFKSALREARVMRERDPVYRRFTEGGERDDD